MAQMLEYLGAKGGDPGDASCQDLVKVGRGRANRAFHRGPSRGPEALQEPYLIFLEEGGGRFGRNQAYHRALINGLLLINANATKIPA